MRPPKPKQNLVQDDTDSFNFDVKPKYGVKQLTINWTLIAKNFSTSDECIIQVEPQLEEHSEIKYVYTDAELRSDETFIMAKVTSEYLPFAFSVKSHLSHLKPQRNLGLSSLIYHGVRCAA